MGILSIFSILSIFLFVFVLGVFCAFWLLDDNNNYKSHNPVRSKPHPSHMIDNYLRNALREEIKNTPLSLDLNEEELKEREKEYANIKKETVINRNKEKEVKGINPEPLNEKDFPIKMNKLTIRKGENGKEEKSEYYSDPSEAICVNSRADCVNAPGTKGCFLGSGHIDFETCLKKAKKLQEGIDKHNIRYPFNDPNRRKDVKYISWAPADLYPDNHQPQCLVFDETAIVKTDENGWRTFVRNPKNFEMTDKDNIYMVEGTCPVYKS